MKLAKVYSICGEHFVDVEGKRVFRASDEEGGEGVGLQTSALKVAERMQMHLEMLGVTHCIDLADPEGGPQEEPVPIADFFARHRAHIRDTYDDEDEEEEG